MKIDVEAAGTRRTVEIHRDDTRYIVTINGRTHQVDVCEVSGTWSVLIAADGAGQRSSGAPENPSETVLNVRRAAGAARSYQVGFADGPDGAMMVHVDGHAVAVSVPVAGTAANRRRGAAGADDGGGPHRVAAPMPGKVVKILVSPGDRVEPRQALIVVEAMKMENELRARRAGTVAEIRVSEGSSVEAGTVLIVVE